MLASLISEAEKIVFFTGAGISTESGIADFRSPGGIWSQMKPIQFQDFMADEATRREDWRRRFYFQSQFDQAQPNEGHAAIARVMNGPKGAMLITQNIDGLHQRSGIADDRIIEIHGNGTRAACLDCETPMSLQESARHIEVRDQAPRCEECGGLVKAQVISFGQPMPQDKMIASVKAAMSCDLFVVIGSSLVVRPASDLPLVAQQAGARLAIINREATPHDSIADLVIHESITHIFLRAGL